jgi:hypothetical protein
MLIIFHLLRNFWLVTIFKAFFLQIAVFDKLENLWQFFKSFLVVSTLCLISLSVFEGFCLISKISKQLLMLKVNI